MQVKRFATGFLLSALLVSCSSLPLSDRLFEQNEPTPIVGLLQFETPEALKAACSKDHERIEKTFVELTAFDGTPSVQSVLMPYNDISVALYEIDAATFFVGNTHPDAEMRAAGLECDQKISDLATRISISRPLYDLIGAVDVSQEDAATQYFTQQLLRDFELTGVNRDKEIREKVRVLSDEISKIGNTFRRNISEDVRTVTVSSVEELAGLPEDFIENHPPDKNGNIAITTEYPDYFPVMTYAHNDDLRRNLRREALQLAYPINKPVLSELIEKRHELATTLGFKNWAEFALADKMVGKPERAQKFIDDINEAARGSAQDELALLLARMKEIDPKATKVQGWQVGYLNELVRQEQYSIDAQEVRKYFQYDHVLDGVLKLTSDLFGVEFQPWDTEVWHESVEAYQVIEKGKVIGLIYLDMHPREGKYKHAGHFSVRRGIPGRQLPISALVTNFPGGDGTAGLMEHGQVETFLHEFGHLIHNVFAGVHQWNDISGNSMERDFVEAPSQMLEEWVWDYDTLKTFAVNSAGETIPESLVEKMNNARYFGQGIGTTGQTMLAAMSLGYYSRDPSVLDLDQLNEEMQNRYSVFEFDSDNYRYASFGHLNGYSAYYYTYQWSLAIASDMFSRFEDEGMRNKRVARDYRRAVLASGGSKPADKAVEAFLGRPFTVDAYMQQLRRGVSVNTAEE